VFSYNRQAFAPGGRYVVRKTLKVGDQTLQPGDAFPWQDLGFDARRVKTLYNGRFIEMVAEPEPEPTPEKAKAKKPRQPRKARQKKAA